MRLVLEAVDSGKGVALPNVGGYHPIHGGTEQKEKQGEGGLSPPALLPSCLLLSWDICLLRWDWGSQHRLPRFSGLQTWTEWHYWLSWVSGVLTVDRGVSQPSQSCKPKFPFMYVYMYMSSIGSVFSGEP